MAGALLDTHTIYWLVTAAETLSEEALISIAHSQVDGKLYVSPISAWELAIASRKPAHRDPPDLGANAPSKWFSRAVIGTGAKLVPIRQSIACEAAAVAVATHHRDPGDCYLIATARIKNVPIITRDAVIRDISLSGYVDVIVC